VVDEKCETIEVEKAVQTRSASRKKTIENPHKCSNPLTTGK
jgi:hypothetical protein